MPASRLSSSPSKIRKIVTTHLVLVASGIWVLASAYWHIASRWDSQESGRRALLLGLGCARLGAIAVVGRVADCRHSCGDCGVVIARNICCTS